MECTCGFNYATTSLDALKRSEAQPFESFLVVRDEDFPAFIQAEFEMRQASAESDEWWARFGKAAGYAGTMHKCPQCQTLMVVTAKGEREYYAPMQQGKSGM